jgi:tetratricopeptide (TPR) repeat protein
MGNSEKLIQIDNYLNKRMTKEELISFEKELFQNHELAEEVKINKNLFSLFDSESWDSINVLNEDGITYKEYLLSKDTKRLKGIIKDVNDTYKLKSINPIIRYKWYVVASSFLILMICGNFLMNNKSENFDNVYKEYHNLSELPSLTNRNDSDRLRSEIEVLFKDKKYTSTLKSIDAYETKYKTTYINLNLYKGFCYLELNKFKEALKVFSAVKNSNHIDKNKAYWYLSITYLKQKDYVNAIKNLKIITKNSYYNHKRAEEILKKIK